MRVPHRPGLEKDFDCAAAGAYAGLGGCPVFAIERRLALRELKRCRPQGSLLDAGCGPGHLLKAIHQHFPGLELTGLDINPGFIEIARQNLKNIPVRLVRAGIEDMPLEDESLDFVITTGSLHHWRDANLALAELYRVLKPGGQLILIDLRRDCPRLLYAFIRLFQLFMPGPIRRHNGPVGSFWASYTVGEARRLLQALPFKEHRLKAGAGWFLAWAKK